MMRKTGWLFGLLIFVAAVAAIWTANQHGVWYGALITSVLIGLFMRKTIRALVVALLAALAGWGFELLWNAMYEPIGGAASAVAGMMGLATKQGGVVIALTLILAFLLGAVGAWFGIAVRGLLRRNDRYFGV